MAKYAQKLHDTGRVSLRLAFTDETLDGTERKS